MEGNHKSLLPLLEEVGQRKVNKAQQDGAQPPCVTLVVTIQHSPVPLYLGALCKLKVTMSYQNSPIPPASANRIYPTGGRDSPIVVIPWGGPRHKNVLVGLGFAEIGFSVWILVFGATCTYLGSSVQVPGNYTTEFDVFPNCTWGTGIWVGFISLLLAVFSTVVNATKLRRIKAVLWLCWGGHLVVIFLNSVLFCIMIYWLWIWIPRHQADPIWTDAILDVTFDVLELFGCLLHGVLHIVSFSLLSRHFKIGSRLCGKRKNDNDQRSFTTTRPTSADTSVIFATKIEELPPPVPTNRNNDAVSSINPTTTEEPVRFRNRQTYDVPRINHDYDSVARASNDPQDPKMPSPPPPISVRQSVHHHHTDDQDSYSDDGEFD